VPNLSFCRDHAVSGNAVGSYHALNLAIHLLAGLTLFRHSAADPRAPALREKFGHDAPGWRWSWALLWTVHPLQTEAVTYVVQRPSPLMPVSILLTPVWFHPGDRRKARENPWLAVSMAACWLGMATKEVMVSAPLMIWLTTGPGAGSFREAWRRRRVIMPGSPDRGCAGGAGWPARAGIEAGRSASASGRLVDHALTQFRAGPLPATGPSGPTRWSSTMNLQGGPARGDRARHDGGGTAARRHAGRNLAPFPAGLLGAWFFALLAPSSLMPQMIQHHFRASHYLPLAAVLAASVLGLHALLGRRALLLGAAGAVACGF